MTRLEEIEERKLEIRDEVSNLEDLNKVEELNKEIDALNEEAEQITESQEQEEVAETLEEPEVKAMAKEVSMELKKEEIKMETRNTKEYIDAFAEYIKTGEERALLTENVNNGTIAVPDFVLDEVKTAWDNNELLSLVRKTNVKGNLKVQFEISGSDAVVHTEGGNAVTEEELVEGIVELKPQSIKKWVSISDEVYDLRGEAFLRYIYDELTYRIAKKAADLLVAQIKSLTGTASASAPSVGIVAAAPAVGTIATAVVAYAEPANMVAILASIPIIITAVNEVLANFVEKDK